MSVGNRQQGRSQHQRPTQQQQQRPQQQPAAGSQQQQSPGTALQVKEWEFVPFLQKEPIRLSISIIRQFVAIPTKKGFLPDDRDIVKFIMLCKAGGLNPFERDAFLVGYDGKDGPAFNLITAHQAFLKRAEVHPEYDGMDSGVIVLDAENVIIKRDGSFSLETDRVVGGWATIYFKKRGHPCNKTVKLSTYNTGYSRWEKDPAGMIVKVAEAAALRSAFPSTFGGMYLEGEFGDEEVEILEHADQQQLEAVRKPATSLDQLSQRLEHRPLNQAFTPHQPQREPVPARQQQRSATAPREMEHGFNEEAGYQDHGAQQESYDVSTTAENEQYLRERFSAATTPEAVDQIVWELKGQNAESDWSEWSDLIEELAQKAHARLYQQPQESSASDWPDRQRFLEKLAERADVNGVTSLQKAYCETNPAHKAEIEAACEARKAEIVAARTEQAKASQGSLLK